MPYNVYDGNGNKILQDQPSTFTLNNLAPVTTYSNYKVEDTQTGKTVVLKPFKTSAKPATGVTVGQGIVNLSLSNNQTTQITPTVTPQDTTDVVSYTTSNQSIATVNGNGLVTGVGQGTAFITVLAGSQNTNVQINVGG